MEIYAFAQKVLPAPRPPHGSVSGQKAPLWQGRRRNPEQDGADRQCLSPLVRHFTARLRRQWPSAIEWVMGRYQNKQDKASGIMDDRNAWSEDPRYIVNLVKRVGLVSMETLATLEKLPKLDSSLDSQSEEATKGERSS